VAVPRGCWGNANAAGKRRANATPWLLNPSARLALQDDEGGTEGVARLLESAQGGASRCLGCPISGMEVLCRVWKDEGERNGRLADAQSLSLPIH
jgi:hypothetical protein